MSAFELGAVSAGALILLLITWVLGRSLFLGGTFHQDLGISFDKDIPDDSPSNDPEISFDKDIPDDRP